MISGKYIAKCSVHSEQFTTLTKSVNQGKVCQLFSVVLVKLKHQREPEKTLSVSCLQSCASLPWFTHTHTRVLPSHDYTHTLLESTPQIPQAHILVMVRDSPQYPISKSKKYLCIAKEGFVTWKSLKFPKCWQAKRHRLWWGWWFSGGWKISLGKSTSSVFDTTTTRMHSSGVPIVFYGIQILPTFMNYLWVPSNFWTKLKTKEFWFSKASKRFWHSCILWTKLLMADIWHPLFQWLLRQIFSI